MDGERTYILNGRFENSLDGWTVSGTASYSTGFANEQAGAGLIFPLSSLSQQFSVPRARRYTLHLAIYGTGNLTVEVTDANGHSLTSQTATYSVGAWVESNLTYGLVPGTTYTLTLHNESASALIGVDDVWLWWVPKTRAELAAIVDRRLDSLADDAGFSATLSGSQTEGSYTDAVDSGLRSVGAINPETDLPDIRYLEASLLDSCLDAIERGMLKQAQRHYATLVDTEAAGVKEALSQIAKGLGTASGGGASAQAGGGRAVVVRSLKHEAKDYELGR